MIHDNRMVCPCCHGTDVVPIIYGCSAALPEIATDKKRIYITDKCQDLSDPEWHCNRCGLEWWGTGCIPDKGCPE